MRFAQADTPHDVHNDRTVADIVEISVALPWFVIRIELPRHAVPGASDAGHRSNARRRSPATAEPSPRAAARPTGCSRPSTVNSWRT